MSCHMKPRGADDFLVGLSQAGINTIELKYQATLRLSGLGGIELNK